MRNLTVMTEETDRWIDLAKIFGICAGPFFLIQTWIKNYFKDKAQERDAALQVLINQTIDNRVTPDIQRLTQSIDKLNEAITDLKIRANKP